MTVRNRLPAADAVFEPVDLDRAFPVSTPPLNIRGDVAPVPPHVHDCLELGYCYAGTGVFTIEAKIFPFQAGDVAIVNHRELHQMVSTSGGTCRWRFVYLDPLRLLAGLLPPSEPCLDTGRLCGERFINLLEPKLHPGICASVHELIAEMLAKKPGYQPLVRALVWSILQRLSRLAPPPAGPASGDRLATAHRQLMRIHPAMEHISRQYAHPISLAAISRRCGLSASRFRDVFKEATGLAPADYLVRFRMNVAATLLRNPAARILDVALASGYPTLSNFNRHFKERFGVSPRTYRAQLNPI